MTIWGKSLSECVRFQKLVLVLILIVGGLRLGLSLAGMPNSTVKWLSLSVLSLLGACYYAIRIHTKGFGSYRNLLAMVVIQSVLTQAIIILAIVLGIVTGHNNIFTALEFTVNPMTGERGVDGKTWGHAGGHAFFGIVVGPLLLWGIGSLVLLIARKAAPRRSTSPIAGTQP